MSTSWPVWSCEFESLGREPVYVGTKMKLVCAGESIPQLQHEKVQFRFPNEEGFYTLHLLTPQVLETHRAELVVTGYKPGNYESQSLEFTDGENGFRIENLTWNVESVLKGEKKEPYPPFGPFRMSVPIWYWLSIALVILALLIFFIFKLKKYFDRKKLIEQLKAKGTALTPFNQFNKELRFTLRGWQARQWSERQTGAKSEGVEEVVTQIDRIFREYVMREFLIPTLEWSDQQVLKEMRRRHRRIYEELKSEMERLLRELKRAKLNSEALTGVDCEQLAMMSQQVTEKIHAMKMERSQ